MQAGNTNLLLAVSSEMLTDRGSKILSVVFSIKVVIVCPRGCMSVIRNAFPQAKKMSAYIVWSSETPLDIV